MPIDEARIREVHATVRGFFKGAMKSTNKFYDAGLKDLKLTPTLTQKMHRREVNSEMARYRLDTLRESKSYRTSVTDYGFEILEQENPAGNCVEMAAAAAYLVARDQVGTAWLGCIGAPGDHAFCLVDNGLLQKPDSIASYLTGITDMWVIDPWANICCKMHEYDAAFSAKMKRWSEQGKRIRLQMPGKSTIAAQDPAAHEFLNGFRTGPINYVKARDQVPKIVPKGLALAYPDSARTIKKGACCVIL